VTLSAPLPASPDGFAGPLLDRLAARPGREDRLVHVHQVPARAATLADWPSSVPADVRAAYAARGIEDLWLHQVLAAEAAFAGQHVVLATGTASGKSLAYQLPALSAIRSSRGPRGERGASVLYLSPTKALAQDQLAGLLRLGLDVRFSTHDGDSPREQREWTRDHGEYVLTNPDMLHRSMLPMHSAWTDFWRSLRYVVVDEAHHYRGIFGAHVALVLRRLRRVCARHGATPTFILTSATIASPERTAAALTGLDVLPVTADHSPRGPMSVGLWEPPLTQHVGENEAPVRRAATTETADLLTDLVLERVRTLAFVRSRRGVEQVALTTAAELDEVEPGLGAQVAAYRGGYLPEERREIEEDLRGGRLLGLAATNALELGIDVSGLDAVLLAGFPGTRAALWQQLGRAGRSGGEALGLLVARDDPLDTYLVHHPESLFGQPVEATVFDPENPHVLGPHLCAAAQEVPIREDELGFFGPTTRSLLDDLVEEGRLRRRRTGWFWTDPQWAAAGIDIRSTGGQQTSLIETETGRVIGTVDGGRAHSTAHAGAVYVHRGESWLVTDLDLDEHVATLAPVTVDYSTTAREITDIAIRRELRGQWWGPCRVAFGEVEVTQQVVSYLKRRQPGGDVLGEEPLDLPARTHSTRSVWWTVPEDVLAEHGLDGRDLPGSAHAAEHCSIGLLPIFATCDRWDIGGVSTAHHPDTGQLTVFVYDGHPGGAGFAEHGYDQAPDWLRATRAAIADCECPEGCPSCVQSPKCGNQNNPLDKAGAIALLDLLLSYLPTR